MADRITCPVCQATVVLDRAEAQALCAECHDMNDDQLIAELQKRVDRALWTALRAVEDQVAYSRWASSQGKAVPADTAVHQEAADLLRKVLKRPGLPDTA